MPVDHEPKWEKEIDPPISDLLVSVEASKSFSLPKPGQLITSEISGNTYVIGQQIGEGNFGHVFECVDNWDNNLAAKVLKPNEQHYEMVRLKATREFQTLIEVRHPFITYVFDAFEFQDTFYIITERCIGPLSDILELDEFTGDLWLLPVARCLLQAVQFMHNRKLIHKDIHLGNVFTNRPRNEMGLASQPGVLNFKLGDLGISTLVTEMQSNRDIFAQWMIPPEVIIPEKFGSLDHRVDIYHCGLLFLQILRGQKMTFTPDEIVAGEPRKLALELPMPYRVALEKTLRRRVNYRTASAGELWRDLNSPLSASEE